MMYVSMHVCIYSTKIANEIEALGMIMCCVWHGMVVVCAWLYTNICALLRE